MLGKIEGRRSGQEVEMVGWHHRLDGHEFEQAMGVGEGQGAWGAAVHGVAKRRTRLSDSTATTKGQGCRTSPCPWHSRIRAENKQETSKTYIHV